MALRLIEIVLPEKDGAELRELLKAHELLEHRQIRLIDEEVLVRILLDAEQLEAVLDLLESRYTNKDGKRVVILPVEATLPRAEPEPTAEPEQAEPEEKSPERIAREELYEDIKDAAHCSRVYLAMVALSTIVAAIGLYYNSVAIIIGAMVIAPLLGPNMAMALATTLGDLPLLWRALKTSVAGTGTVMALSVILGVVLQVDPALPEVASRNGVALGDVVVALASGAHLVMASGALSLFLMNLICINLAGVTTFLVQGIRPASWLEKDRAAKATRISIMLWGVLLAALIGLILVL